MLFSAGAAPGYNFTPWVIVPILVFLSPGLLASFLLIQGYAWFSKALISNKLKIVRNTFGLLAAVGISVFTWWLFHIQDVGK